MQDIENYKITVCFMPKDCGHEAYHHHTDTFVDSFEEAVMYYSLEPDLHRSLFFHVRFVEPTLHLPSPLRCLLLPRILVYKPS